MMNVNVNLVEITFKIKCSKNLFRWTRRTGGRRERREEVFRRPLRDQQADYLRKRETESFSRRERAKERARVWEKGVRASGRAVYCKWERESVYEVESDSKTVRERARERLFSSFSGISEFVRQLGLFDARVPDPGLGWNQYLLLND